MLWLGEWVSRDRVGWRGWVSGRQVGEVGQVRDWFERLGEWVIGGKCWVSGELVGKVGLMERLDRLGDWGTGLRCSLQVS